MKKQIKEKIIKSVEYSNGVGIWKAIDELLLDFVDNLKSNAFLTDFEDYNFKQDIKNFIREVETDEC